MVPTCCDDWVAAGGYDALVRWEDQGCSFRSFLQQPVPGREPPGTLLEQIHRLVPVMSGIRIPVLDVTGRTGLRPYGGPSRRHEQSDLLVSHKLGILPPGLPVRSP